MSREGFEEHIEEHMAVCLRILRLIRQLPDGKKSVSFRLAIGSDERTLTSGEIEKCAMSVVKRLKEKFNIELRGYSLDN